MFPDEFSDEPENFVRILIWNQTHADFRFCPVRNRGLDARSGVTSNDPVHFECRTRPYPAGDIGSIPFAHLSKLVRCLESLHTETGGEKIIHLGFGEFGHVVVKTRNSNFPGADVIAIRDQLAQLRDRVSGRATRNTGVNVLRACFQNQPHRCEAPKAIGHGGPAA